MVNATPYHSRMHLAATQLADARARCPVCGSQARRSTAARIQSEPAIFLLRCADCGGCSASQMPTSAVLEEYYRSYYRGDGPRITLPQTGRFVRRLLRVIRVEARSPRLRLLDFGGGDGALGVALARELLARRADRPVDLTLVDYQTPATVEPSERLTVRHRHNLESIAEPFDLVLASAVLEHIPDLAPVLERLFGLLAPGGWFYARTPYVAPLLRLMPNLDLTYPGHVHDLGAPFWNRVAVTYRQPLRLVVSRPSLIETDLWRQPGRTLAAWLMKLPARIELAVSSSGRTPWWRLVGGWEVILRRRSTED